MDNKLYEITKQVLDIYFKYGIKSVTMDDVARELGISKKTLYQYFKDKDDLVEQTLNLFSSHDKQDYCYIDETENNAIDILLLVSEHTAKMLNSINPAVVYDLQKYYPKLWKAFNETKRNDIYTKIKNNMDLGIKQGLYRDDLNIDLISRFYVFRMEMSFHFDLFKTKEYTFEEIFTNLIVYHIRGIANSKGIEYLEQKIKENKFKISLK